MPQPPETVTEPSVGSPAESSDAAYARLTRPDTVDLWGPPTLRPVEGITAPTPRPRKPWGLADIGWGLLGLLAAQVVLLPLLVALAILRYHIALDQPGAADRLTEALTKVTTTGPGLVVAMLTQWAVFVGAPWLASYRKGHRSLVKDFGLWFKKTDLPVAFGLAVGLQAVMLSISWLLHQTSLDLSGADNTGQVTDQHGVMLAIMIVAASIGAPITEELFFRGLILRACLRRFARLDLAPRLAGVTDRLHDTVVVPARRRLGVVAAALTSAAIFGLMHLSTTTGADGQTTLTLGNWLVVAQTGLLGLVFAVVAIRTRRIGLTITTHFFFNSASLALVFLTTS